MATRMSMAGAKEAGAVLPDVQKMEDEVKLAELEAKLRQTVVEMVRPTVQRAAHVQTECQDLKHIVETQGAMLKEITAEITLTQERANLIMDFKRRQDDFSDRLRVTDTRLSTHEKAIVERVEGLEQKNESQAAWNDHTDRTMERVQQDFETFHVRHGALAASLDTGLHQNRELIAAEAASMKISIKEVGAELHALADDIWGPEEPEDVSPPSLRRLDMQMRKVTSRLADVMTDLVLVRKLDQDVHNVSNQQIAVQAQTMTLQSMCEKLRERVEKIAVDTKQDSKAAANRMAAFTASLMKDVRGNVGEEVRTLQHMQSDMQTFVRDTQTAMGSLDQVVQGMGKQLEAAMREMHTDLDSLDSKRKRDKHTWQEGVSSLQGQVGATLEASEASLRALEHISNVLSMSLQSERMSVALDVQDFVERKATPYVGVRNGAGSGPAKARRKEGLDPTSLTRLVYQPQPVSFQSSFFDRSQLLALREKLLHAAQEALLQGPTATKREGGKQQPGASAQAQLQPRHAGEGASMAGQLQHFGFLRQGGPPPPVVPNALGTTGDILPSARRAAPQVARPGSRGQPSARGSPLPEGGDFHAMDAGRGTARDAPATLQDYSASYGCGGGGAEGGPLLPAIATGLESG